MTNPNPKDINQPSGAPRAKRQVTVDGVRYSLNTGDRLGAAMTQRPDSAKSAKRFARPMHTSKHSSRRLRELPLPNAVEMTAHQQAIMHPDPKLRAAAILHPHGVSHPSLPLSHKSVQPEKTSLWKQVFAPSLADSRSRRGVLASIGIVILSPMTWLYIFLPAAIFILIEVRKEPLQNVYDSAVRFLQSSSADLVFWILFASIGVLGLMWFIRHLCLIVAYGLAARKIDSRSASVRHLWWQAAGKIWRFATIAVFDFLLVAVAVVVIALVLSSAYSGRAEELRVSWGATFNLGVLAVMIWVWLVSTHRPIARVMLALTNRPASFIIVRSFGLVFRNLWRSIIIGLFWIVSAGITAGLVAAICWSTVVYGLLQITTSTGRLLLFIFAASLVMFVLSLFTIWSVSYWPRAYHLLARLAYPKQISQLMVDAHHEKSMRRIGIEMMLLVLVFGGFLAATAIWFKPYFATQYHKVMESAPKNAQDIFKSPQD